MLVSGVPAAAPGVDGGGRAGVDIATLARFCEPGGHALADSGRRTGRPAGVFVQFRITARIGFQPEVMFSIRGASVPTTSGNATIELSDHETPLLPALRGASPGPASFHVVAGVTLLFNLRANVALDDGRDVGVDDGVETAHIAIIAGAGLQGLHWLVESRFNPGLRDIAEPELVLGGAVRRRALAGLAGLGF
jgi:hypothetical protein